MPLVLLIPAIIEQTGAENIESARVAAIGWFIVITLPIAVGINILFVPERKARPQPPAQIGAAVKAILRNLPLRRLLAADFLSGFGGAALASMYIYEATYVWGIGSVASFLLLLYFFGGIIFIPVVLKISYRFGKHNTVVMASVFNALFAPVIFLIPEGNAAVASLVLLFLGVNVGTTTTLYRSMMADVADIDELETGQRRTGLFYALLTLTQKLGAAFAVGVIFWTLALVGFDPQGENTPGAIQDLQCARRADHLVLSHRAQGAGGTAPTARGALRRGSGTDGAAANPAVRVTYSRSRRYERIRSGRRRRRRSGRRHPPWRRNPLSPVRAYSHRS